MVVYWTKCCSMEFLYYQRLMVLGMLETGIYCSYAIANKGRMPLVYKPPVFLGRVRDEIKAGRYCS
jgi:hypothetical protein